MCVSHLAKPCAGESRAKTKAVIWAIGFNTAVFSHPFAVIGDHMFVNIPALSNPYRTTQHCILKSLRSQAVNMVGYVDKFASCL